MCFECSHRELVSLGYHISVLTRAVSPNDPASLPSPKIRTPRVNDFKFSMNSANPDNTSY